MRLIDGSVWSNPKWLEQTGGPTPERLEFEICPADFRLGLFDFRRVLRWENFAMTGSTFLPK